MDLFGSKVKHKFLEEAQGIVAECERLLNEKKEDRELSIYHLVLALNGSAMCAGFEPLSSIGFTLEEWMQEKIDSSIPFNDEDIGVIVGFFDFYKSLIDDLGKDIDQEIDTSTMEKTLNSVVSKSEASGSLKGAVEKSTQSLGTLANFKHKVLVVDDDEAICDIVRMILESEEYECETFIDPTAVPDEYLAIDTSPFSLILSDLKMPGLNGIEFAEKVRKVNYNIPIIIMSGFGEKKELIDLMTHDVECFIDKPFKHEDLLAQVHKYLNIYHIRNKLAEMGAKSFELSMEISKIHRSLEGIIEGLGIEREFRNILECSAQLKDITHELLLRNEIMEQAKTSPSSPSPKAAS